MEKCRTCQEGALPSQLPLAFPSWNEINKELLYSTTFDRLLWSRSELVAWWESGVFGYGEWGFWDVAPGECI